jgi:mannose-6-phosphate isomerase-like protein (cupin superfamily)
MLIRNLVPLAALVLALPGQLNGQQTLPATDVYAEQIQTVLKNMIGVTIDRQVKVGEIGGDENVAVGILHRTSEHDTDGAHTGLVHTSIAEVYVILSGWGTLLTGGELFNQSEVRDLQPVVGPSFNAESRGGVEREIETGDVVVIPVGAMHSWTSIPDHVTYLSIRVDPDQVLPTGYVNPEIQ